MSVDIELISGASGYITAPATTMWQTTSFKVRAENGRCSEIRARLESYLLPSRDETLHRIIISEGSQWYLTRGGPQRVLHSKRMPLDEESLRERHHTYKRYTRQKLEKFVRKYER